MVGKSHEPGRRQKVQSAEVGVDVLKALGRLAPSASLSQLAEAAEMPPSKAHRYLKALIASGFAEQDPPTGRYRLGPEALYLGLAALGRIDVVAAAAEPMAALNARLRHSCILAVWANRGATVVKVVESPDTISLVTRIGSVLPLLTSATGLVFAAFLPAADTDRLVEEELTTGVDGLPPRTDAAAARARIAEVRQSGLATVQGLNFPGVDAIAAPVRDLSGKVSAVLAALGPTTGFDVSADGESIRLVRAAAEAISERIGHRI